MPGSCIGDDLRRKALELYYSVPQHRGRPPPSDEELKERNLWREAHVMLLRSFAAEVGEEIQRGEEALEAQIKEVRRTPRVRAIRPILPPKPDLISLKHTAEHYLFSAYAGDPIVNAWLQARGFTTDDLEEEIKRLDRALGGEKVGPPIIDILRMDAEISEKRRLLERLLRLEELLEGVRKGLGEYRVEMEKMGFPTVEALEAEVHRVRRHLVNT
jgi:hypothetical protein